MTEKSSKKSPSSKKKKSKIEEFKKKIEECEKEKEEYLACWKRAKADYLNYKKSEAEKIERIIKNANEELIFEILPVLDNLELAEKNLPGESKEDDFVKGVIQIKKQLKDALAREGLEEIETKDKEFDPNVHEVVEEVKKENISSGIIIEEIKKGYKLNGKVIRPSKVKTAE